MDKIITKVSQTITNNQTCQRLLDKAAWKFQIAVCLIYQALGRDKNNVKGLVADAWPTANVLRGADPCKGQELF